MDVPGMALLRRFYATAGASIAISCGQTFVEQRYIFQERQVPFTQRSRRICVADHQDKEIGEHFFKEV